VTVSSSLEKAQLFEKIPPPSTLHVTELLFPVSNARAHGDKLLFNPTMAFPSKSGTHL
jgi:hypothetical protein